MQRGGSAYGLDKELATKALAKYDTSAEDEAREWIESITGRSIGADFGGGLKDGIILCELINNVEPSSRIKVSTSSMPFRQMENVTAFIRACRSIGVMEFDLFETVDLYEQKDLGVVVRCIHALGRTLQKKATYKGPILGVKEATKNERTFTDAQLAEARHATSLLNMGSQAFMDRPNIDVTSSVTFGYDSTSDLPPPSTSSFVSTSSTTTAIPSILTKNSQGAFASSSPEKPFFRRPSSYGSPKKPTEAAADSPPKPSITARWMSATQSNATTMSKRDLIGDTTSESEPTTPTPSSEPVAPAPPALEEITPPAQETTPPVQVRGGGYGLDAEIAAKAVAKYDYAAEGEAIKWIEGITHRKISGFGPTLQNGKILCILINTLYAVSLAEESPIKIESSTMAFKQMQNIKNFLSACRALGVADIDCFETVDLYELKDLGAVLRCLFALNRAVVNKYPEYPGPVLTNAFPSKAECPEIVVKSIPTPEVATPSVATHTFNTMLRHSSSKGLPTRTNWQ